MDAPERITKVNWKSHPEDMDEIGQCMEKVEYIRADLVPQWQPIDDETPSDTVVLLGWYGFGDKWDTCTDYWHSTRGGWFHGSATHWMPLPEAPTT